MVYNGMWMETLTKIAHVLTKHNSGERIKHMEIKKRSNKFNRKASKMKLTMKSENQIMVVKKKMVQKDI